MFNKGTVVAPKSRSVEDILATCAEHEIEVLPTTPTFLRMMLMSGLIPEAFLNRYASLHTALNVWINLRLMLFVSCYQTYEFRQTFGMSELGIVRVKSESSNSLFMKVGGEGVETRVVDNVLEIRSQTEC